MTQEHPSLPEQQVTAPPRPAHATDRYDGPTVLYRMFDADDRLLYVGITCNPTQRWESHRKDSSWWKLVARKALTTYPDRSAALTAELAAIRAEKPLHNIAGHPGKPTRHVHLVLTEERAAKLHALRKHHGRGNNDMMFDLLDAAPMPGPPADEPTDLEVAISVAQQLVSSDQIHSLREALRLLLRALDAETVSAIPDTPRCPAAHPEDPTPCGGPVVVTILDTDNAGADGCEHHAVRLLASLAGGRPVPKPDAPAGLAVRIFRAAHHTHPFPWLTDAPRTRPEQLSDAENRARGERR